MKLVVEYTRHQFTSAHQAFAKVEYSSKDDFLKDFHEAIADTRRKCAAARELRNLWWRDEPAQNTEAWNKWAAAKPSDWFAVEFAGAKFPLGSFGHIDSAVIEMPAVYELEEWFNTKDE